MPCKWDDSPENQRERRMISVCYGRAADIPGGTQVLRVRGRDPIDADSMRAIPTTRRLMLTWTPTVTLNDSRAVPHDRRCQAGYCRPVQRWEFSRLASRVGE